MSRSNGSRVQPSQTGLVSRWPVNRRCGPGLPESTSHSVFERPSIDAVRASTFKPLPPDRKPSGIKTCRTFRFYLSPVAIDDLQD